MVGDRRYENRTPRSELAELRWVNAGGTESSLRGTLLDLSHSGARLAVNHPIPMNARVQLAVNQAGHNGTIKYCVRYVRGFMIGVRFAESSAA